MARLVEKCEGGGYVLIVPQDTSLSDLELKFAVYDKLGALEELEDNGLLYRKVFYITNNCSKPRDCGGDCDVCPSNYPEVESKVIPFSEFNSEVHFNSEEEAKLKLETMKYTDEMDKQRMLEFQRMAYSISKKYNVGQLVAECYLCNHGDSYPCTRCSNKDICTNMRDSGAANKEGQVC